MALTDALSNESHPVTVYLMTRYGRRQALGARWHAQLDALAAVGPVLDIDLAGRLGDAFELCAVVDLADVPPYLAFLEALDPGITAGFLTRAGFEPPPGQETHRADSAVPGFACWRRKAPATTPGGEEIDQFLGHGWILANLYRLYRSLVRDTDPGLLRQILTTGHGDLWPGRGGAIYLRPLWDAYLTAGRAQLRDLQPKQAKDQPRHP